eukprot:2419930-Rhodomonas_salina.4
MNISIPPHRKSSPSRSPSRPLLFHTTSILHPPAPLTRSLLQQPRTCAGLHAHAPSTRASVQLGPGVHAPLSYHHDRGLRRLQRLHQQLDLPHDRVQDRLSASKVASSAQSHGDHRTLFFSGTGVGVGTACGVGRARGE